MYIRNTYGRDFKMNSYFALLAVLEYGSFTKAAEKMGYTQSAMSQLIKTLEKELETTLIIRSRTGVMLTPDGEAFLPYIKQICQAIGELEEKKKSMQGLERSMIRIGAFSSIAYSYLPIWIQQFKQHYPAVQFDLKIGDYSDIAEMIATGVVDFGFVTPETGHTFELFELVEDDLVACLSKEHPLAQQSSVTLAELACEPFILMQEGTINETLSLFEKHQLVPNIQYVVEGDFPVISMVAQNLGVSIMPSLIFHHFDKGVIHRPLHPPKRRKISVAYKDKEILPIASRMFLQFLAKQH